MRNIILVSFCPLDTNGGVQRWNRDFMSGIKSTHYSFWDVMKATGKDCQLPEWEKAKILNRYLISNKLIKNDDVIIVDGFWGLGLERFDNVISIAHGNWSHTTFDDVKKGVKPEFPQHHSIQVKYRRDHLARGGKIVAVSDFIAHQCDIQWGFKMPVINNGIDLNKFVPAQERKKRDRPLIIHGTTTFNKGFDHIECVQNNLPECDVMLLDHAERYLNIPKYDALAQADLVLHPSAHEGNSYFLLEALSCNVPIVSYDVGLMYKARIDCANIGVIKSREDRSPGTTLSATKEALNTLGVYRPRDWVSQFSLDKFCDSWRTYLEKYNDKV